MEIRSQMAAEPRKRFHERKKWKRALKHADLLINLLGEDKNGEQQRALVYRQGLKANLYFAYQKWNLAAANYARYMYCILQSHSL